MTGVPWVISAMGSCVAEMAREQELAAGLEDARRSIAHLEEVLGEHDDFLARLQAACGQPPEVLLESMERKAGLYRVPAAWSGRAPGRWGCTGGPSASSA